MMSSLKGIKELLHKGAGFQAPDSETAKDPVHFCRVLQCIPTPGLPGMFN